MNSINDDVIRYQQLGIFSGASLSSLSWLIAPQRATGGSEYIFICVM